MQAEYVNHKQPKALTYLFLTEMWERFGFYVAQGLLVFYLTKYFGFTDKESFTVAGMFGGLVYLTGIIGGYIADRFLGFKTTVLWGGTFLTLGYAGLALSGHNILLLYIALATIVVGNGMLKPNISSLLGSQYEPGSTNRDAGFTLFYMGINLGVALSGLSGYILNAFGWHVTFACASAGMIIGMLTFLSGLKHIKNTQSTKPHNKLLLLLFLIGLIIIVSFLFDKSRIADWLLPFTGIILLCYLTVLSFHEHHDHRKRMLLLVMLILFSIIFWMLFFQIFFAANLFVDRLVNKEFAGLTLTTTLFYASESVFVITSAPFLARLWHSLAMRNKNPSYVTKFALAFLFLSLGFFVLSICTRFPNSNWLINPLWVLAAYFLITMGEMALSPIGLAAVTELAPQQLTGIMMGTWFVALGFGSLFGGMIAKIADIPSTVQTAVDKLLIYQHAFQVYAYIGFAFAIILALLSLALRLRHRL